MEILGRLTESVGIK